MSDHSVKVVRVEPQPHPNADRLEVVRVWGYQCVVGKGQFDAGSLGVFIPPDSLVDTALAEFDFDFLKNGAKMDGWVRIRCTRLRGELSEGLLVPAREGFKYGQDVTEELNVKHYEPEIQTAPGRNGQKQQGNNRTLAPAGRESLRKYDVENFKRYAGHFKDNELVMVTEKIHGANGRWCYNSGTNQFSAGSRTQWLKEHDKNMWWKALHNHPELKAFLHAHPDWTVYGEVYGNVQSLRYGLPQDVRIAVFDICLGRDRWMNCFSRFEYDYLPWVPLLHLGLLVAEQLAELAEGNSLIPGANHVREGIVVKPIVERSESNIGRVQLKLVGEGYYAAT